jgi:hypothetical protein
MSFVFIAELHLCQQYQVIRSSRNVSDIIFFFPILNKTGFSCHILIEFLHIKFIKLRPRGAELFSADVQTDRHDKTKSLFF